MNTLRRFLATCGAGLALTSIAMAQPSQLPLPDTSSPPPAANRPAPAAADDLVNADYSLKQREDRLTALLDSSLADGSLGKPEYARGRDSLAAILATEDRLRRLNHGELTDTQTYRLESRIKTLVASLRWNP
jgi:hypothetical protein